VADLRERLRWWIVDRVNRIPGQCWADLVMWAMRDRRDKGWGFHASMPWQPVGEGCRRDAERNGRCYCGTLGADGVQLRHGESVCMTRMPGREDDRLCSRPNGHDGMHRCGGVEWGRV
jgi:hypothetical protein